MWGRWASALFFAGLVLLVPASASWADDVEPSGSPSPSGSPLPSDTPEPEPSGEPSPEPSTAEPSPSEPTAEPSSEPTPPVVPEQSVVVCAAESPCVVEPSEEWLTLQVLMGGVSVMALLALMVRGWGS